MNKNILLAGLAAIILLGGGIYAYRHFHGGQSAPAQTEIYYCPMHPDYTADKPGDCPICGMHLVKRENAAPAESAARVAGRGAVTLTPEKQRMIGLKTERAAYRNLSKTIRASGKVAYDPDLYRAIDEYRESQAAYEKIKDGSWREAADRAKAVADSARLKLRQLGIGEDQLAALEKDPGVYDNLLLAGNKVWVYAQVYEYESAAVKAGQRAAITSSAYPGRVFSGTVRSVDPIFSEATRTLRARIETENPGGELRSEMYVEAAIKADIGSMLTVPVAAVLNTGEQELAFVAGDKDTFEPRLVKTGRRNEDHAEIISGLRAGEKVVTSANFMVDSESRMKAALGN